MLVMSNNHDVALDEALKPVDKSRMNLLKLTAGLSGRGAQRLAGGQNLKPDFRDLKSFEARTRGSTRLKPTAHD